MLQRTIQYDTIISNGNIIVINKGKLMFTTQDFTKINNPFANMFKDMDLTKNNEVLGQMSKMWQNFGKTNNNSITDQFNEMQEEAMRNYNESMKKWFGMCPAMPKSNAHNMFQGHNMNDLMSSMMKNINSITKMAENISEQVQNPMKRATEMLQKQSSDMYNFMKELSTSHSPELAMAAGTNYSKKGFEKMVNNMKEISELATKSGSKSFETLNKKFNEFVNGFQNMSSATEKSSSAAKTKKKKK